MPGIRAEIRRISQQRPLLDLRVEYESVRQLTDSFVRVSVRGSQLAEYDDPRPADAFKLLLPTDTGAGLEGPRPGDGGAPSWQRQTRRPVMRAFTVRDLDPAQWRLTFDVLLHAGHTLEWLRRVRPGDEVGLAGMRVDYVHCEAVDHQVFVADAAALPAVAAILESLPWGTPVTALLALDHSSDRRLVPERAGARLVWVEGGSPTGSDNSLVEALRALPRPRGRVQAWACGEATTVRQVRAHLVHAWGVHSDDLHASAYWRQGLDASANDAQALARYQDAIADGAEPTDPTLRESIELASI